MGRSEKIEAEVSIGLDEFYAGLRRADSRMDSIDRRVTDATSKIANAETAMDRLEAEVRRKTRQLGKKIAFEAGTELAESLLADIMPEGSEPIVRFGQSVARGAQAAGVPGAVIAGLISFVKETAGAMNKRMEEFSKAIAEMRRKDAELTKALEQNERDRRKAELAFEQELVASRTSFKRMQAQEEFLKDMNYQAAILGGRR